MNIRPERASDIAAIRSVVTSAFQDAPHSGGDEAGIVDALRADRALTVSLVASDGEQVVGHVAFSPVRVDGHDVGWFGLGPLAVLTPWRRQGIGGALIKAGLAHIRDLGGRGCVVLGEPAYYGRFGFESDPGLWLADVPVEYFQRLVLADAAPRGAVTYHPAFSAG